MKVILVNENGTIVEGAQLTKTDEGGDERMRLVEAFEAFCAEVSSERVQWLTTKWGNLKKPLLVNSQQ